MLLQSMSFLRISFQNHKGMTSEFLESANKNDKAWNENCYQRRQLIFTCSNSILKTLEKGVKYVQS